MFILNSSRMSEDRPNPSHLLLATQSKTLRWLSGLHGNWQPEGIQFGSTK